MTALSFPRVSDVMTRKVFAVGPGTSIETAARLLAQKRVSGAPVVLANGEVVGVVSISDLVDPDREQGGEIGDAHYYLLEGGSAIEFGDPTIPREGTVGEVMTLNVLSIGPELDIIEAGRRMVGLGVHRMLVVDETKILVGIVSVIDLVRGFVGTPGIDG
ncbi:MAG: CBS domain-containing protein [Enhygromyxa sp.]|jgi:CBS domain-containing protein